MRRKYKENMKNVNPTETAAWQELQKHFKEIQALDLKKEFENDPVASRILLFSGRISTLISARIF